MSKIGYIQRYLLLIRRVRSHPYITLEELRREVERELITRGEQIRSLSQRTVERDLREIRSALGISIDYSRTERGYFIPFDEGAVSDLERILEPFEVLTAMRQDAGTPDFIFPEQRRAIGTEHLYPECPSYNIRLSKILAFGGQSPHVGTIYLKRILRSVVCNWHRLCRPAV